MHEKTEYISTRSHDDGSVDILEHFYYGPSSVLEGQMGKRFIDVFPSMEAAIKAYPGAEGCTSSIWDPVATAPHCPPPCFDPADAGESWDEI